MKRLYFIFIILITLSGFGQMPIFKRYYVADIPGLGWLAEFYVTHLMHYLTAIGLTALFFYVTTGLLLKKRSWSAVTKQGWAGGIFLFGLIVSGALLVIKNLEGIYWPHALIIGLNLVHLVFCMGLLGTSMYSLVAKKAWIEKKSVYSG